MAAGTYNIIIEQGADFSKSLSLTDNAGDPFDLSDYSAVNGQIRRHYNSESVSATFTMSITGDGTAGQVAWGLGATATAAMEPADHLYDVELVKNDGTITRLLQGSVEVRPNITR